MKLLLSFLLGIVQTLVAGFVLACLWDWFIVSRFPVAPTLDFRGALGVMFVVNFLLLGLRLAPVKERMRQEGRVPAPWFEACYNAVMALVCYPLVLGASYVWHLCLG